MILAVVLVGVAQRNSNNWYQSKVETAWFYLRLTDRIESRICTEGEDRRIVPRSIFHLSEQIGERGFHPLVCSGSLSTAESKRREGLQRSLLSSRNIEKKGREGLSGC